MQLLEILEVLEDLLDEVVDVGVLDPGGSNEGRLHAEGGDIGTVFRAGVL